MNIRELQKELYENHKVKGYVENFNSHGKMGDIAELGLIITEVSEAIEEIRKPKNDRDHLAEECVDIIIRTLNFMSRKGFDIEIALYLKSKINEKREWLHGKEV